MLTEGFLSLIHLIASSRACSLSRGDPGDRVRADRLAGGLLGPVLKLALRHLRPVGNHAGEVHRVVVAGVVQLEREGLVAFDFLGDRFQGRPR